MTPSEILENTRANLKHKHGYAYDLLGDLLSSCEADSVDAKDADCLFRTLVQDEGFDLDEAGEAYQAAVELLENG